VNAVIDCRQVAKTWPSGGGLRPVDLTVAEGQILVVRGRSGSGKSTLLALLAGWSTPSAGTLERSPTSDPDRWSGTAVVPQVLGLTPELSVIENVLAPLRLAGGEIDRAPVDALLDELDVAETSRRLPHELSLGQRQRVAIARAVVARPKLLLVDEPTSHQDVHHAAAILGCLHELARSGSAVIVATHDPTVIAAADAVVDLDVHDV
jgi:putative ABC transport system ATP-binding protein